MAKPPINRKASMMKGKTSSQQENAMMSNKTNKQGSSLVWTSTLLSTIVMIGVFALPICILLVVGLLPTFVAGFLDTHPRRMMAVTIGPLNLAGAVPFIVKIWAVLPAREQTALILTNPTTWFVIYLAAAFGWLLYMGIPFITRFVMEQALERKISKIEAMHKNMRAEWGDGVDTAMATRVVPNEIKDNK